MYGDKNAIKLGSSMFLKKKTPPRTIVTAVESPMGSNGENR